jgi:ribosome-binding protein aMBF1 (putative translation factor)
MDELELVVQVQRVAESESALATARKEVARSLRRRREDRGLSLRQVAPKVRLTAPTISQIERGEMWRTKTVLRLAKFYDSAA